MTDPQRQLLSLLVMDLGFTTEPRYGEASLRHQFAWKFATDGVPAEEVAVAIKENVDQMEREKGVRDRHHFERQALHDLLEQREREISLLKNPPPVHV